jgi:hypothetical protein
MYSFCMLQKVGRGVYKNNTVVRAHTVRYQQIAVSVYDNNTVVRVYTVRYQ